MPHLGDFKSICFIIPIVLLHLLFKPLALWCLLFLLGLACAALVVEAYLKSYFKKLMSSLFLVMFEYPSSAASSDQKANGLTLSPADGLMNRSRNNFHADINSPNWTIYVSLLQKAYNDEYEGPSCPLFPGWTFLLFQ